jgi:DivIVA domain-containing protein
MADEVANRTFTTSFRGFDPGEVRAYLAQIDEKLDAAAARESELKTRLAEAEERAAHPDIDEDTLLRLLGDETARVMRSAREAATDLRAHAEEAVEQILRDAHEQARALRSAAESVLSERTALAEEAAAGLRRRAEEEAAALVEASRAQAAAELEAVRDQAKAMVMEAQGARERILADLTRRRRLAHIQVEQLRAGRDRLLEAYRLVRSTLEDVTEELQNAEHEARAAAEAAARRLAGEDAEAVAEIAAQAESESESDSESDSDAADDVAASSEAAPVDEEPVTEPEPERAAPEPAAVVASEPPPRLVTTTIAAESPAPVTAEPSRPASVPVEERRLSSLRVLRRPRAAPAPAASAEPEPEPAMTAELEVVEARDEAEGVRVIEPAPDEPALDEPVLNEPVLDEPAAGKVVVEDLFARIRAARAEAVDHAREVLGEPDPSSEAEQQDQPPPEPDAPADRGPEPAVSNEDEQALQRRDEAVADIEARLTRKIKRSLQDEQNDLLDRLRSLRGKPAASVVPDPAEHAARHVAVALPFLTEAAEAGAAGVGVDVGAIAAELVESIVGPLRRQLERAVQADDDSTVADRIGMAYREWKGDRIERLVADAAVAAWSAAWFAAAQEGMALRWVVDDQDGACPDCDDNALAGPTAKGAAFPTGQVHPPAHSGCRCLLVPAAG